MAPYQCRGVPGFEVRRGDLNREAQDIFLDFKRRLEAYPWDGAAEHVNCHGRQIKVVSRAMHTSSDSPTYFALAFDVQYRVVRLLYVAEGIRDMAAFLRTLPRLIDVKFDEEILVLCREQ
jgi:hypothetical protein